MAEIERKGLLALDSLDLLGVELVPVLELTVVAEQDVLALFFSLIGVLLEVDQVLNVDQLAEGILLNLLLGLVGSARFRRLGRVLAILALLVFGLLLLLGGIGLLELRFGDLAIDHAIFLKTAFILSTIFESKEALAVLEVLVPVTLVLATVGIVERTLAVAEAIGPVAHVAIAQELVVARVLEPDVRAEAVLEIVLPVAAVTLIAGKPVHFAMAVTLIVFPFALVIVLAGIDHLAMAPFHAALPLTRVDRAVLVAQLAMAMAHAVLPVALVLNTFFLVDVGTLAVAQTVQNVTLVGASIWPGVAALAADLVLLELAAVDSAVSPLEDATTREQTECKFALVLVAVLELARTVAMVHVADLEK